MLSKKMSGLLNSQLAAETYSGYLYLAMNAWLWADGCPGAAHWMERQAREEWRHAMKFFKYLQDRDGQIRLGTIEAPPAKWKSPREVFEAALAHEQKVTGLIANLMNQAKSEGDHASEIFLQWFVTEQVEEEAAAREIVNRYKLAGDQGAGLFIVDQELGARV